MLTRAVVKNDSVLSTASRVSSGPKALVASSTMWGGTLIAASGGFPRLAWNITVDVTPCTSLRAQPLSTSTSPDSKYTGTGEVALVAPPRRNIAASVYHEDLTALPQ